jgi:ribonuclease BN (tRNA processing enzyme)
MRRAGQAVLLDAGTGVRRLITDSDLTAGLSSIDILLSHFHLDHVSGLGYLDGLRDVQIRVWGPGALLYGKATGDILDRVASPPLLPRHLTDVVESIAEIPSAGLTLLDLTVTVRPQESHTAPSLAFRLGDLVSYCTDTEFDAGNISFAHGCHTLLHEAWSASPPAERGHTAGTEAAAIALAADVRKLYLVHMPPNRDARSIGDAARNVFPATEVAEDGVPISLTGNH